MSADSKPIANGAASDATAHTSSSTGSLQTDLNEIRSALEQASTEGEELTGADNLKELLQNIEHANGVAGDVEGKLDDLLGNLDALLKTLEPQDGQPKQEKA